MRTEFFSSPSQVSTYELCARKWAWRNIDGIEAPPNKYAAFGLKTHSYLEKWLKKRVPPGGGKEAQLAQLMLAHLPPPHLVDPQNVEFETAIKIGDVNFAIVIDLFMPDLEVPTVYDHKTTKDFKWALRAEALTGEPKAMMDDVQATMYSAWAFVKTGASQVDVQWTYGKSEGAPDVHPVKRTFLRHDVEERLKKSIRSAQEMRVIQESGCTAIEVPYDATGCEAFGGCPYQSLCNLSARDKMASIMAQGVASMSESKPLQEDFIKKMRDRKNKNGASPGQVNPPAVKAEAAPAAAAPTTNKLAAKMAARKAAAAAPAPAPEPEPEVVAEAAPAEEEAPKAGRGRPKGSKNSTVAAAAPEPPPMSEQWVAFAGQGAPHILGTLSDEDVIDPEMQALTAQAIAGFADAMLKEYLGRFGD